MKWADLEVGDVLRVRDKLKKLYIGRHDLWVSKWCDKDLVLAEVLVYGYSIHLRFANGLVVDLS